MTKTFLKLVRHPAGPIAAVTGDEGKLSIKAPLPNDDRSIIDDRHLVARQFVQIVADEGPRLADYLPQFTTISDIGDIFGQMAFFEAADRRQ